MLDKFGKMNTQDKLIVGAYLLIALSYGILFYQKFKKPH
jgi:hypothetical protein